MNSRGVGEVTINREQKEQGEGGEGSMHLEGFLVHENKRKGAMNSKGWNLEKEQSVMVWAGGKNTLSVFCFPS